VIHPSAMQIRYLHAAATHLGKNPLRLSSPFSFLADTQTVPGLLFDCSNFRKQCSASSHGPHYSFLFSNPCPCVWNSKWFPGVQTLSMIYFIPFFLKLLQFDSLWYTRYTFFESIALQNEYASKKYYGNTIHF
jgi:hypothetical protein